MDTAKVAFSFIAAMNMIACTEVKETDTSAVAEEFSARINGQNAPQEVAATPTVVPPRQTDDTPAFTAGTANDPNSATCNANKLAAYIGRPADDETRLQIMSLAAGASDVRFVTPGAEYIRPDATNPRLNVMLDQSGIIRDVRCG